MESAVVAQLEEAAAVAETEAVTDNSEVTTPDLAADMYPDEQAEPEEGETGEEGEEFEQEEDEPEEAIVLPASLKPDEQERFKQLPPEAQQFATEVLSRRDKEIQQGLNSAREAQRTAERAAADQVAEAKADFAERTKAVLSAFAPQPPDPLLAQQNPGAYIAQKAIYDQQIAEFNQLFGQVDAFKGDASQHFEQQKQEWYAEQRKQLMSVPEFADESTRATFLTDIETFASSEFGYSPEEISQAGAKDILLVKKARDWKAKADKWEAYQKRRMQPVREAKRQPKVAGVGARGNAGQADDVLKALYPND